MNRRKIKIYIAGPYTSNPEENTKTAINVWERLFNMDFVPFCPHLMHYIEKIHPHPYKQMMGYDIEWLKQCDCVYRFAGESKGADEEVAIAKKIGIPVFYDYKTLFSYYEDLEITGGTI